MPRRRSALVVVLALLLAACGSAAPATSPGSPAPSAEASPSPSPEPTVALACVSIQADECSILFMGAVAALPAGHPEIVAASVQANGCSSPPCPPGLAGRGSGQALMEYAGGTGAAIVLLALESGAVKYTVEQASVTAPLEPESAAAPPQGPFSLGHCGLLSPVDYDASFWDPVGQIDGDNGAVVNSTEGTIRLISDNEAEFRSADGFTVRFRRHEGPKAYQLCM
jgi:hypothetical protein